MKSNFIKREHYMLPMDHPIAIENMRRKISPATVTPNVFNEDELEYIWKWAFSGNCRPRLNRNGTILLANNLHQIYHKFKDKIDAIVGKEAELSPAIGGNYFITPQQYGLHNDSIRPEDWETTLPLVSLKDYNRRYTCWKNFLIPLWIGTHLDEVDGGQILFFNERHIDWAHVYNSGNLVPNIASVYKITHDYSGIQFYDGKGNAIPKENNSVPFNKDDYEKYSNTPYDRLQGLSLENAFDWVPGSALCFDAVQLHASNEGTKGGEVKKTWNSKMGLLLTFLVELDEDLKEEWFFNI